MIEFPVYYRKLHVAWGLLDDADASLGQATRWSLAPSGHAVGYLNGCQIAMHRALFGLQKGDEREVHHWNADGLDNRRENLEVCANSIAHMQLPHDRTQRRDPDSPRWSAHNALYCVRRPVADTILALIGVPPKVTRNLQLELVPA